MSILTKASRCSGFASFDAVFSMVPMLLMLLYALNAASFLSGKAAEAMQSQQSFDKVVSAADYIVKQGAARSSGSYPGEMTAYPNWLEEGAVDSFDAGSLGKALGIGLEVSLDSPGDGAYCVYRLVAVGDKKEIRKLFVCGG